MFFFFFLMLCELIDVVKDFCGVGCDFAGI